MSHEAPKIGLDGKPLPVLPPPRDPRLSIRVTRVMFYTPGFVALLLLKAGEPTSFGLAVEFLMLAGVSAVVAGLFIATDSTGGTGDNSSRVGLWSGALVLELMGVVSFLNAMPTLFHQLANSELLKKAAPGATEVALGYTELIPAAAIIPFIVYQLAGFGTLSYLIPKVVNWLYMIAIAALIVVGYRANITNSFDVEKAAGSILVILNLIAVVYGIFRLKAMQAEYDANRPPKHGKHDGGDAEPA
ncbi:MAG TPA: hypothetical protein PL196_03290 [Burkholderiaceae bacterium]|nr:hypothetical protein [Burkholderiaceae bacterium]